jgi:hypothetical protein
VKTLNRSPFIRRPTVRELTEAILERNRSTISHRGTLAVRGSAHAPVSITR